jgi:hypothetical protein
MILEQRPRFGETTVEKFNGNHEDINQAVENRRLDLKGSFPPS